MFSDRGIGIGIKGAAVALHVVSSGQQLILDKGYSCI